MFTGLTTRTAYTFTVVAKNDNGNSPASAPSNSITVGAPGAPTIGTASATASATSATVTWTAPTVTGGSGITGYTVTSSPSVTTPAACSTSLNGSSTTCVFTGLTTGTAYTFTVSAINANGTGLPSAATNSITVGTPGAPTIGTASRINGTSVSVSWTAPAANGGAAVTGYVVTPYIGGTAQAAQTFNSTATTETVTGLSNSSTYTFQVAAINSVGTGPPSGSSNSANG